MVQPSFSIDVNPGVLQWAREAAGQSTGYVAERLGVSEQTVRQWETGRKSPPWHQLRKLANYYQRPLAALLLPEPPTASDVPTDFRTLPANQRKLSARTLLAIRTARWLQGRAVEMRRELGRDAAFPSKALQTTRNPESAATRVRERMGVSLSEQTQWRDSNQAYRRWREVLEHEGVLVFQFAFPVNEVRGFSLFDPLAPVIVVNESDAVNARIFTVFHEYAHLLLQKPGICLPQQVMTHKNGDVEPFCNRFSAALLIPREEVLNWTVALDGSSREVDRDLLTLASRYRVSKDVVLTSLRAVGLVSEQAFTQITSRWRSTLDARLLSRRKPGKGGPSAAQMCQRQRGAAFISLVYQAADRGAITTHDAITYLGVKLKDFNKLRPKR